MINPLGTAGAIRGVDQLRAGGVKRGEPAAKVAATGTDATSAPATPAAQLAAEGAPIDSDKVAAVKAQIEAGTYRIDPQAIANRMIALDLPGGSGQ